MAKNLVCRNKPILYSYVPALEEELSLDPRIVFYHHVISDRDIQLIQNLSIPKVSQLSPSRYLSVFVPTIYLDCMPSF